MSETPEKVLEDIRQRLKDHYRGEFAPRGLAGHAETDISVLLLLLDNALACADSVEREIERLKDAT